MRYPFTKKQTLLQWILNTVTPSMWNRPDDCECCWDYLSDPFGPVILWIVSAGCERHD